MSTVEKLHKILNDANISDDVIIAGVTLKRSGEQKLAGMLGVSASSVTALIDRLASTLRSARTKSSLMNEAPNRFSIEGPDFLGNITIHDAETGHDVFLSGTEAAQVLRALAADRDNAQDILGGQFALMEDGVGELDNDDIGDIMTDQGGSYNFVYDIGILKGTGTAKFKGSGKSFTVNVVSVRDENGIEISPSSAQKAKIHDAAVDFIGKE